jgi:repressor LexA
MSVSENIRKFREEHGMTQSELGDILGVTDKAVSAWELGTREPRMGVIQKLADYFGVRKSDIIESPSLKNESDMPDDDKVLLYKFRRLNPKRQTEMLNYLEFLAQQGNQDD